MVREDAPRKILGYYTLSSFAVQTSELPEDIARKLPRYPTTPATLIGRLARDTNESGLGSVLLADALKRILASASEVASALVVVDAKNENAAAFYRKFGFLEFAGHRDRLFMPMKTVRSAL